MKNLNYISKALFAIAMMLCVAFPTLAHDFEVNGIYYNVLDETTKIVEVTSGSVEYTGSVTIPSSVIYNGTTYIVTEIGSSAFSYCRDLTSVTMGNFITKIGDDAFWICSGLTSLTIPNSVVEIGYQAFCFCTGLTSVTIGNSVISIGNEAFYGCTGLTEMNYNAENCTSMGSTNYPVFSGCSNLKTINIGNSVKTIPSYAFESCTGLTSVTIPNSVTSIGSCAFKDCVGLAEVNYNAENCTSMGSIKFPVFGGCSNLKKVNIGSNVKSIPDYAFCFCTSLTSISIPNSVTTIGYEAFCNCSSLTKVNVFDLSAWCKIDFDDYMANPLFYAKKLNLNGTEIKDLVIPNDVTEIKKYAFTNCTGLTSITIPNSVTSIGKNTFYNCTGLTSVSIGNSVAEIGSGAFASCERLTSINMPNSVITIGSSAFSSCERLTSVIIPNSVITIGENAFYSCEDLTSVIIGNSVTTIGEEAFSICWNLRTIISLNFTPPVCSSRYTFEKYSGTTLYVPQDSYTKYFNDEVWGKFSNIKKIEILASSITLNNSSIELYKENTTTLIATIAPSNATMKNIVWTSSNPQIATVNQLGEVVALSVGEAIITAKTIDGSNISASCKVEVKDYETKITLSQTEANLPVNDIMILSYAVTPSTTPVEWSTSNAKVAYIKERADNSLTVVGVTDGVAIITAKALDGSDVSVSCVVTVGVGGVEGVEVDDNVIVVARYDIHGRLLSEPTKGLNIIKMSDGSTRKEIVK